MLFNETKEVEFKGRKIKEKKLYNDNAVMFLMEDGSEVLFTNIEGNDSEHYFYMGNNTPLYIVLGDTMFTIEDVINISLIEIKKYDHIILSIVCSNTMERLFIKANMKEKRVDRIYDNEESRKVYIDLCQYACHHDLSDLKVNAIRARLIAVTNGRGFEECLIEQAWDDLELMKLLMKMKDSEKEKYLNIAETSASKTIDNMLESELKEHPAAMRQFLTIEIDDITLPSVVECDHEPVLFMRQIAQMLSKKIQLNMSQSPYVGKMYITRLKRDPADKFSAISADNKCK